MHIINLDPDFRPFFDKNIPEESEHHNQQKFKRFDFPSGCETHIKFENIVFTNAMITCRIRSSKDIMLLLLATDAIRREGVKHIKVFIPYLPYARQDRVMVPGEPLSIKVLANLLNSQGYERVGIFDPHSEVSLALIDNSMAYSNHLFVAKVLQGKKDYFIVSPDAGAHKKIFKLCQDIKCQEKIISCNKNRDVSTGHITGVSCSETGLSGKDVYIIDDICDGGGTFVILADELRRRNCGKINLVVSHGIFSKGMDPLKNIDHIYTTDSFQNIIKQDKITQIKLADIL